MSSDVRAIWDSIGIEELTSLMRAPAWRRRTAFSESAYRAPKPCYRITPYNAYLQALPEGYALRGCLLYWPCRQMTSIADYLKENVPYYIVAGVNFNSNGQRVSRFTMRKLAIPKWDNRMLLGCSSRLQEHRGTSHAEESALEGAMC